MDCEGRIAMAFCLPAGIAAATARHTQQAAPMQEHNQHLRQIGPILGCSYQKRVVLLGVVWAEEISRVAT